MSAVGFVGLGAMGSGMAANLARHLTETGQTLHVYNRDPARSRAFRASNEGLAIVLADSLEQLTSSCSVIFTMLSHDAAVKDVMGRLCECFKQQPPSAVSGDSPAPQRVLVDCSTVSPETTDAMSNAAQVVGAMYVACPVLGRPDAAAAAKLLMFCAGPEPAKHAAMPYLGCMSRKVLDLGSTASKAHVLKLLANFHLVSLIELLAEGMTLAEKNGIGRGSYMEFIDEILPVPIVHGYGSRMAADAFDAGAGFTVTLGLKDVNLMRKLAENSEMPLPLADVAFNHLLAAKACGLASKDWSALGLAVRANAGLALPQSCGGTAPAGASAPAGAAGAGAGGSSEGQGAAGPR